MAKKYLQHTAQQIDDAVEKVAENTRNLDTLSPKVGDLTELETEAKDNLVNAINEAATKGGSDLPLSVVDGALCVTFNE